MVYIAGRIGEYDWILMIKDIDFAAHMARFDTYLFGPEILRTNGADTATSPCPVAPIMYFNTLTEVAENLPWCQGDVRKK
jgi:hypothetical protein